ncbi:unnamed protein product [Medioppia subpectinata]|uniref:BTB domain-containing protein n=1 Tax=Medioppia subpectinata TaxID=1979941 RepID=A0A7R9PZL1_9ACAR|nr:unnamed protein product [Medioppia subpectinata]CAG2107108.1 unnamed protein product [Medioppia subpectinata]
MRRGRSEATIRFVVNDVHQLDTNRRFSAVTYIRHLPWQIIVRINEMKTTSGDPTYIRHLPWQIIVRINEMKTTSGDPPSEVMTKYLGCFVCCDQESRDTRLTTNWWCNARVEQTLVAQSATGHNITDNFKHKYISKEHNGYGFGKFIAFEELLDPQKGFIEDNTIVVEAKVSVDRLYGVIMRSNAGNIFQSLQWKSDDIYPQLDYFMNESKSDVVFKVEGKRIPALKEIICFQCNYFRSMFSGNYTESKAKEIEIADTTCIAFKAIIWYLYSHELAIDSDDMLIDLDFQYEVYRLADSFQIKRLLNRYETKLKANITEENLELAFIDKTFNKLILEDSDYLKKINGFTNDYMLEKTIESSRKRARITQYYYLLVSTQVVIHLKSGQTFITSYTAMNTTSGDTEEERGRSEATIRQLFVEMSESEDTIGEHVGVFLRCQYNGNIIDFKHKYISKEHNGYGFGKFIAFEDLLKAEMGFIEDNTIVVEAKVSVDRPYGVIMRSNAGNIFQSLQWKSVDIYPQLDYLTNESKCDVVFKVEAKRIPAVKDVLCFQSDYFRSMFSGNYTESKAKEIEIADTTCIAFKAIIWYLYSHELAIDSDDMLIGLDFQYEVYRLADSFQIKRLLNDFENQLKANITEENLELFYTQYYYLLVSTQVVIHLKSGQTFITSYTEMNPTSGDTEEESGRSEGTIRFVVNDITQLNTDRRYSAVTYIRHLPWQLFVEMSESEDTIGEHVGVFLRQLFVEMSESEDTIGEHVGVFLRCQYNGNMSWWCTASADLTLVAQLDTDNNFTRSERPFNIHELVDPEMGFINGNTIVVEAKVSADPPYGVNMVSNIENIIQSKDMNYYPELAYFMNESMSDVVFKVEGKHIPAVKELLSFKSDYFRSMFSGNYTESNDKVIEIPDTTCDAFKVIVWYLYSQELAFNLTEETDLQLIYDVFKLADRFQIKRLLDYYENQLKTNITEENLELVSRIAFEYKIDSLRTCVKAFIDKTFQTLVLEDMDYMIKMNGLTDNYLLKKMIRNARKMIKNVE